MINGWPLALALVFLVAWLPLLCWAIWKAVKKRKTGFGRSHLTIMGLGCGSLAVTALLGMHLSWISADISQRLGVGTIRVLSSVLFWSTITGLILNFAGSGKIRFAGVATCLATGFWWYLLAMSAAISMGPATARHPTRYLISAGYVGWVSIEYGVNGPPLEISNGFYICRIPASGVLTTSSALEEGWAKDEYFYYAEDGSLKTLPETGWGKGGMIWAGSVGLAQETDHPKPKTFT